MKRHTVSQLTKEALLLTGIPEFLWKVSIFRDLVIVHLLTQGIDFIVQE